MGRWDNAATCACGRKMERGSYVCALCRRRHRSQAKPAKVTTYYVRVVHDPTNTYPRNRIFPRSEFWPATRTGDDTTIDLALWSEGMVIEDAEGQQYRVVGEQLTEQTLEQVEREAA